MSIAVAVDVAYARFCAPDLALMRRFLLDFGMVEVSFTAQQLCMRGHGVAPFVHITDRGEAGFAGFGIWLESSQALERLASHDGVALEPLNAPGGGLVARLQTPDGFSVEAVVGEPSLKRDRESSPTYDWNEGDRQQRLSIRRSITHGPSHVRRLGHVVLSVSNFHESETWFKQRFGFITSDEIITDSGERLGAFLRCDRGDNPSDHHSLFLLQTKNPPAMMHVAYEVNGVDDLMVGHDHLKEAGYQHFWGIGRHILGNQIFDYWKDPFGNEIEHWTDGDQLRARDAGGIGSLSELRDVQWGMKPPPRSGGAAPSRRA